MQFDNPVFATITAFLDRIGIRVIVESVPEGSFLPGATVRGGALVFDPARMPYPGDLLHEAGHIAVTDPAIRDTLDAIPSDPAEEMATIAWSYAAALEAGVDPAIVFHEHGYKGGAADILASFQNGTGPGVAMLAWFGMSAEPHRAAEQGVAPYPAMTRWLR